MRTLPDGLALTLHLEFDVVRLVCNSPVDLLPNFRRKILDIRHRLMADLAVIAMKFREAMGVDFPYSLDVVNLVLEVDPGKLSWSSPSRIRAPRKRLAAYHDLPDSSFQSISCKTFFSCSNSSGSMLSSVGLEFSCISRKLSKR